MVTFNKRNFPLFFLITLTIFWGFYFSGQHWLNGFGQHKHEWLLLIETLVSIPLVCIYCYWHDIKTALLKSVVYMGLMVLLGSVLIPVEHQIIWPYLINIRYVLLAMLVLFELATIITVAVAIKAALNDQHDPDEAIRTPIQRLVGDNLLGQILMIEARVWSLLLLKSKMTTPQYQGDVHFLCDEKDATASNLLGFVVVIAFELPLVHVLLHFVWSPMAANVVSLLTLLSLFWFIAEYRAIQLRPVSLTDEQMLIRYGLLQPLNIALNDIECIALNAVAMDKSSRCKRFNNFGYPNVVIVLKSGSHGKFDKLGLGLNHPAAFVAAVQSRIKALAA